MADALGPTCESIVTFGNFLSRTFQDADLDSYIWRGQPVDRPLVSSLYRVYKIAPTQKYAARCLLEEFKRSVIDIVKPERVPTSESEWWALAQHSGLQTPLLDWTFSPFTACYFGFRSSSEELHELIQYRVIYALHRDAIAHDEFFFMNADCSESDYRIRAFYPMDGANDRRASQDGLFTFTPWGQSIEDCINHSFADGQGVPSLLKFIISERERNAVLNWLRMSRINELTMFLDLEGAARQANNTVKRNISSL